MTKEQLIKLIEDFSFPEEVRFNNKVYRKKDKLLNVLNNNISNDLKFEIYTKKQILPFYKGDWESYFKNQSGFVKSERRIIKNRFYIRILSGS